MLTSLASSLIPPPTPHPKTDASGTDKDRSQSSGIESSTSSSTTLSGTSDTLRQAAFVAICAVGGVTFTVVFKLRVFIVQHWRASQLVQDNDSDSCQHFSSDGKNPPQMDTSSTVVDVSRLDHNDQNGFLNPAPLSPAVLAHPLPSHQHAPIDYHLFNADSGNSDCNHTVSVPVYVKGFCCIV